MNIFAQRHTTTNTLMLKALSSSYLSLVPLGTSPTRLTRMHERTMETKIICPKQKYCEKSQEFLTKDDRYITDQY